MEHRYHSACDPDHHRIEDDGGSPVELFKAPASLAVGAYPVDPGPEGHALTANEALKYVATAGVGLTISGYKGYSLIDLPSEQVAA